MPAKAIESLKTVAETNRITRRLACSWAKLFWSSSASRSGGTILDRLSKLDPGNPKVWKRTGTELRGSRRPNFEELEESASESAYWLMLVAETVPKLTKNNRAFFFYREALARMPNCGHPRRCWPEIYRKDGTHGLGAIDGRKEESSRRWIASEASKASAASGWRAATKSWQPVSKLECDFWAGPLRRSFRPRQRTPRPLKLISWRTRALW